MSPRYNDGSHYNDPRNRYDDPQPLPTTMADKPVTYPVTEVLGFCDAVAALLTTHKTEMIADGVDPTALMAAIATKRDTLNTQNTAQEALKTQLKNQTAVVDAANSDAYHTASKGCDQVIAAYGNTATASTEARNLRKGLQHKSRTAATPTPTPSPPT